MRAAARLKQRRYRGQVRPLVIELRGPLCQLGRALLEDLAAEAGMARPDGPPPSLLVRRWRRDLEVTLAFEVAEALRAAPEDPQCQKGLPSSTPSSQTKREGHRAAQQKDAPGSQAGRERASHGEAKQTSPAADQDVRTARASVAFPGGLSRPPVLLGAQVGSSPDACRR